MRVWKKCLIHTLSLWQKSELRKETPVIRIFFPEFFVRVVEPYWLFYNAIERILSLPFPFLGIIDYKKDNRGSYGDYNVKLTLLWAKSWILVITIELGRIFILK